MCKIPELHVWINYCTNKLNLDANVLKLIRAVAILKSSRATQVAICMIGSMLDFLEELFGSFKQKVINMFVLYLCIEMRTIINNMQYIYHKL